MKRLLLIDDEAGIRETWARLHAIMEPTFRGQCAMDTASDLAEGIQKVEQNHYDAIILDLHLPPIPSEGVVKFIESSHPKLPPIIVLTGDHNVQVRRQCILAGAQDFWLKSDAMQFPNLFFKAVYNVYLRAKAYAALHNETAQT